MEDLYSNIKYLTDVVKTLSERVNKLTDSLSPINIDVAKLSLELLQVKESIAGLKSTNIETKKTVDDIVKNINDRLPELKMLCSQLKADTEKLTGIIIDGSNGKIPMVTEVEILKQNAENDDKGTDRKLLVMAALPGFISLIMQLIDLISKMTEGGKK